MQQQADPGSKYKNTSSVDEFLTAVQELAKRKPVPSPFNSAEWQQVAVAIRQRAFFSATVNNVNVLTKWREMLLDWLDGATEEIEMPDGSKQTAFAEVGLGKFRERAARFAIQEGLATEEDFADQKISNVISNARLQLVFNTNTEQAQEFAYYKERMADPGYLNLYPAAKFVRRAGGNPKYFRPKHVANEEQIRRWDDLEFWVSMNLEQDGGFGVPWGPWGFNSYMRQEPVKRKVAERLGLVKPSETMRPPNLKKYGVNLGDQFLGSQEEDLKDVPDDIARKARDRIKERLGPNAIDSQGRPSLKALREARARIAEKYQ